MAYSLRDIIKQRTGEAASSNKIYPTIYKLNYGDDWIESNDITYIGSNKYEINKQNIKSGISIVTTELPEGCLIKQVGTNVTVVHNIRLVDDIIPEDLFKYALNLIDVSSCFLYNKRLKAVPKGLFRNCHKIKNFSRIFYSCNSLYSVPLDLFSYSPEAINFTNAFAYSGIKKLQVNLFANNKKAKSFYCTFASCLYLEKVPDKLFDNNKEADSFEGCFIDCVNLVSAPKQWEKEGKPDFPDNIKGSGYCSNTEMAEMAEHYDIDIPIAWKTIQNQF